MKKRYLLTMIAALLCFMMMPGKGFTVAAADTTHPGYHVEGRFLYDNQGEKVILYGVNKMCTWMDKDGDPAFKEIAKTGSNCVRIVWSITDSAEDLDTVLFNCRAQHMIPIIELHDATGDWSKLKSLVDYWVKPDIAAVLIQHQDYIIVNIGNEVGQNVSDSEFKEEYGDGILRMRTAGIHVPIMIDASGYGKDIDILQSCGPDLITLDPDSNLLFSVHMWWPYMWGYSDQRVVDELQESADMNLPLVVGEFGDQWDETERGQIPYKAIMENCFKQEIGYLGWSWGPGNHPQTFLDMTTDGTFATLNSYGNEICFDNEYSIKNIAKIPASMSGNLPPKMPAEGLPAGNLAYGKKATASSSESNMYLPSNLTDGDASSRWASKPSDPIWTCIDLGSVKDITKMIIKWEAAYSKQYKIEISDDGKSFKDAYTNYSGEGNTEEITLETSGRYVKINCMQRVNWSWGCSIFEVGIYGPESALSTAITPSVAVFDKALSKQKDLVITTSDTNNTLLAIKNANTLLTADSDYIVSGNTITITKAYLASQPFDETIKLTFDYDNGVDPILAVAIGDTGSGTTIPTVTTLTPSSAQFNKYLAGQTDIKFTFNPDDITVSSIVCGTASLTAGTDYTITNNAITLKKSFMAQLPVGTASFTISFDNDTQAAFTVNIVNIVPNSTVAPATADFEKRAQADVAFTMDLKGNTLVSITNGSYTLLKNTDYTVNNSVVTINKAYLASLATGTQKLVFNFDQGNTASVTITITETIPNSVLDNDNISYSSTEADDITVTITFNGNTLVSIINDSYSLVLNEDYTIDGNKVTISKNYLASLTNPSTKLTFTFSEGNNQTLTLKDTSIVPSTLKTEFNACMQNPVTNSIMPRFLLTNTGTEAIDLSTVTLRYYFTKDGDQQQNFWCDWSSSGNSNVIGTFIDMEEPKENADCYLEISFKSSTPVLVAGKNTQIQGRFAKSNWSNYNQANDYSFGCKNNSYGAFDKVTTYINGNLVSGMEP